jgi:heptose I phosphotransferase
MTLYLHDEISATLPVKTGDVFAQLMQLSGECFRKQPGRMTQRVELANRSYFIKQHFGIGWREIFKNLAQLRLPVLGASNEKRAIDKLAALGIAVPQIYGYGKRGCNPAAQQSFILLEALTPTISLEELVLQWRTTPPTPAFKRQLIAEVARMARIMHDNGVNHRDFYICHFLLHKDGNKLSLIDLHRALVWRQLPERWRIKDLAGLYFSSLDAGLTKRDRLRFIKQYRNKPLRDILASENKRWQKVKLRGEKLYCEHA